jgi:ABC-type transporter Mla MlaB component
MRLDGDTLKVEGAVTLETVPALVDAIDAQLDAGARRVDFSAATEIDSGAVALALEWRRRAAARSVSLAVVNPPEAMRNLAQLYGVAELIEAPA